MFHNNFQVTTALFIHDSPFKRIARSSSPGWYFQQVHQDLRVIYVILDVLSTMILPPLPSQHLRMPGPLSRSSSNSSTTGYSTEVIHPPRQGVVSYGFTLLLIVTFSDQLYSHLLAVFPIVFCCYEFCLDIPKWNVLSLDSFSSKL